MSLGFLCKIYEFLAILVHTISKLAATLLTIFMLFRSTPLKLVTNFPTIANCTKKFILFSGSSEAEHSVYVTFLELTYRRLELLINQKLITEILFFKE